MLRLAATTLLVPLLAALAAVPPASAALITVTADDCATIVAHTPSGDVAYQPGVDVDGNPVVSADLDSHGQLDIDESDIIIDIDIPLRAVAGVVGDEATFIGGKTRVGVFTGWMQFTRKSPTV